MAEAYVGNGVNAARVRDEEVLSGECDGQQVALSDLERAEFLKGMPGLDVTPEVVEHRELRCIVASRCHVLRSGNCALKAAGLLESYPKS